MSNTIAGLTLYGAEDIGDDYGRFLLHGSQGSGKTFLGSTIAALGKTLLVDMRGERGSRSWLGTPWANNITVVRPKSIQQMDDIFYALDRGEGDFKAVVLDSLTGVQKMTMRFLRSEEHTSELQSLMRISYAVFSLKKKKKNNLLLPENNILQNNVNNAQTLLNQV